MDHREHPGRFAAGDALDFLSIAAEHAGKAAEPLQERPRVVADEVGEHLTVGAVAGRIGEGQDIEGRLRGFLGAGHGDPR